MAQVILLRYNILLNCYFFYDSKGENYMRVCIAVFRSRTQVMAFIEYMQKMGVNCTTVPTPKEAKIGCGISAKVPISMMNKAAEVISANRLTAFYGFFVITKNGNRTTTVRF